MLKILSLCFLAACSFYLIVFVLSFFKKEKRKKAFLWLLITNLIMIALLFAVTYLCKGDILHSPIPLILITCFAATVPIAIVLFCEDIFSLVKYGKKFNFFDRDKKLRLLASAFSFLLVAFIIHGAVIGKTNFYSTNISLNFKALPQNFDGFKVLHISDLHLGSFTGSQAEELKEAILGIDKFNADLIVFTGDLVNLKSEEAEAWKDIFNAVNAPYGKYAVLGNHDYGHYFYPNDSPEQKIELEATKKQYENLGFILLDNTSVKITKDSSSINLMGVGHFSASKSNKYTNYANLKKASVNSHKNHFNLLLCHNPQLFDIQIDSIDSLGIDLTLAGHTHGMQFGINNSFLRLSPAQLIYDSWLGLYSKKGRYLYVNSGLGYHIFPARVGVFPEFSLFELKKEK